MTMRPTNSDRRPRGAERPLPTLLEQDAMINIFYKDSTGKGLEALARSGRQKLEAIAQAEKPEKSGAGTALASKEAGV